jgi:hypothetical protein
VVVVFLGFPDLVDSASKILLCPSPTGAASDEIILAMVTEGIVFDSLFPAAVPVEMISPASEPG